jgi:hypothetical protein
MNSLGEALPARMKETSMSPLALKVLVECCVSGKPGTNMMFEQWNSDPAREIRQQFYRDGITNSDDTATDRGLAWLEIICSTPMPVQKWVAANG